MAQATPPNGITPAPEAPQRRVRATFSALVDGFLTWLAAAVPQFNAIAYNVYTNAVAAYESAVGSYNDANRAQGYANNAGASATEAYNQAVRSGAFAVQSENSAVRSYQDAQRSLGFANSAAQSAANAAAISGLPNPAGLPKYKMVVNDAGTGYILAPDINNLNFTPVQQGTGIGQDNGTISIGRAAGTGFHLKATVAGNDFGYLVRSLTPPYQQNTFESACSAPSFSGTLYGNGSNITNLTNTQIRNALGYIPADNANFAFGGVIETGRYIDFHYYGDAINDYDARLEVGTPSVANSVGSGTFKWFAREHHFFKQGSSYAPVYAGVVTAEYFSGNGANITGMTRGQITTALGYTPSNQQDPGFVGRCVISCGPSNFDQTSYNTLRVSQPAGDPSFSAHMEFIREGFYGLKVGLDSNNSFCLGGYSQGQNVMRFYSSSAGDAVAMGNVTAYSDIRFKTQIEPIGHVVTKLLQLELGGFQYLDHNTGQFKYGVSAQDVQKLFPYSVVADANGFLSVAYGQLALPVIIEVAREFDARFKEQQAEIDQLKTQVEKLLRLVQP